jgi:hypothetical protein
MPGPQLTVVPSSGEPFVVPSQDLGGGYSGYVHQDPGGGTIVAEATQYLPNTPVNTWIEINEEYGGPELRPSGSIELSNTYEANGNTVSQAVSYNNGDSVTTTVTISNATSTTTSSTTVGERYHKSINYHKRYRRLVLNA